MLVYGDLGSALLHSFEPWIALRDAKQVCFLSLQGRPRAPPDDTRSPLVMEDAGQSQTEGLNKDFEDLPSSSKKSQTDSNDSSSSRPEFSPGDIVEARWTEPAADGNRLSHVEVPSQ